MSEPTLQQLHAELDALGGALDASDAGGADEIVRAYDRNLRRYVEQRGRAAPLEALRDLLRIQNGLLARMREQRGVLAGDLRRVRRSGAASRAYASAGTDP